MRLFFTLSALAFALVAAGSAAAGGWASVKLAPPPEGLEPGESWRAEITVLRHGITPTDGARPTLFIRNEANAKKLTFEAKPTGATGVYAANVVFPVAGVWRYSVDNGLAATGYGESAMTTYAPVTIGSGSGVGGSFPALPVVALAAALAAAALGAFAVLRVRRRPAVAP
jgi:hypothetical protein